MTEMELAEIHCGPIQVGITSLEEKQIQQYMNILPVDWRLYGDRRLARGYQFENYGSRVRFLKEIEQLAEQEEHHPFVCIIFPKVQVELSSYDIGGLSENDFIMATRIDKIYVES